MFVASAAGHSPFDLKQANTSVWLSAAAFCNVGNYHKHIFKGPTSGFNVTFPIYDARTDTQGFIGILPSDRSIYIVFRGSSSTRDWISNLDARKINYTTFPECDCKVHKGFFEAEQAVIGNVVKEVTRLKEIHPNYHVKVTGHSLGAAMAQLTSMDLYKAGFKDVSVYNFGQPRTGDKSYADFVTERVSTWRVTHHRDSVPHLPFMEMGFYHMCQEQYEDETGNFKTCDAANCEDPSCADQFDELKELNGDDHLVYLGLLMSCDSVSI